MNINFIKRALSSVVLTWSLKVALLVPEKKQLVACWLNVITDRFTDSNNIAACLRPNSHSDHMK